MKAPGSGPGLFSSAISNNGLLRDRFLSDFFHILLEQQRIRYADEVFLAVAEQGKEGVDGQHFPLDPVG